MSQGARLDRLTARVERIGGAVRHGQRSVRIGATDGAGCTEQNLGEIAHAAPDAASDAMTPAARPVHCYLGSMNTNVNANREDRMVCLLVEAHVDGRAVLTCSRQNENQYAVWTNVANEITARLGHTRWTVGRAWASERGK